MKKTFLSIKANVTHSMSCVKNSIKETANYIGISISTLYRWEKSGKLFPDFRTIGLHRRYSLKNLEEKFNLNKQIECNSFHELH
jgi:predicted DNA-binding transcriptional regulator AlpA